MAGKADLVAHLASQLDGVSKKVCGEMVDSLFQYISVELAKGEKVQLPGFGTFQVARRKERLGRHPQTGVPLRISARTTARFQPSRVLLASLPGNPTTRPRKKPKPKPRKKLRSR